MRLAAMPASRILLYAVMAVPLLTGAMVLVSGFGANWDYLNYHFYIPFAVFHDRSQLDIAPAGLHTYYNPTIDLPFYLALRHLPPRLVGYMLGFVAGLNVPAAAGIAWLALRKAGKLRLPLAALSALFAGASANFSYEIATNYYDNWTSLFLLAGFIALLARETVDERPAALSGLLIGLGTGLKYTLAPFMLGVGLAVPLLCASRADWRAGAKNCVAYFLGAALGMAVTAGWWIWHLWHAFGNPVFPLFNAIFRSPYALADNYLDVRYGAHGLLHRLAFPFFFTFDVSRPGLAATDLRYLAAFLVAILLIAVVVWRRMRPAPPAEALVLMPQTTMRFLLGAVGFGYLAWEFLFAIPRYLLPLDMLLPLAGLAAVQLAGLRPRAGLVLWGGLCALLAVTAEHPWKGNVAWSPRMTQVKTPQLPSPSTALVVMAGSAPLSFLVPYFPTDVHFVRVSSADGFGPEVAGGITAYDSNARIAVAARQAIRDHRGALYLLKRDIPNDLPLESDIVAKTLRALNLAEVPGSCRIIPTGLASAKVPFEFCELARNPP